MKSGEIKLIISYESKSYDVSTCNLGDKLENAINDFAIKKKLDINSLLIYYRGKSLSEEDLKKTISQIINNQDTYERKICLLLYRKDFLNVTPKNSNINIVLIINPKNIFIFQGTEEETIKNILNNNINSMEIDTNSYNFQYQEGNIDTNKKFNAIANTIDKKFSGITLCAFPRTKLTVNFVDIKNNNNNNEQFSKECYLEDKLEDVCKDYCVKNGKSINNIIFRYNLKDINLEQTFDELLPKKTKLDITSKNELLTVNGSSEININVIELNCCEKNIIKTMAIILVLLSIITSLVIIIVRTKKSGDSIGKYNFLNPAKSDDLYNGGSNPEDPYDTSNTKPPNTESDSTKSSDNSHDTGNDPENPKETTKPTTKICQPGYFIPDGGSTASDCAKCRLKGCIDCKGTSDNNECINCGGLESIYNDGKIIECKNTCETGEEEKCLTCYEDKIECKSCNIGYKLVNGKCRLDFYVKAIYQVNSPGDTIQLYNRDSKGYVSQLMIGKDIITSPKTNEYQFKKEGLQSVYIKFVETKSTSNTGFFKNIDKLVSVVFSDFNEYFPDLGIRSLFEGCINLISVDISNLSKFSWAYTDRMFYGCIKLEYVNFNITYILKSRHIYSMFYNCWSLKSIDLSKLDVSEASSFDNMFFNCTSLETINIENFSLKKDSTNMNYMFENCVSLKSLDLSSFKPYKLTSMIHTFYNCYSLTSINLKNMYTNSVTNMNYLFYNCSSLRYLDISSFNTEKVLYMNNLFRNCKSLTSIKFGNNFNTDKVIQMAALFTNCNSLKIMDYPIPVKYSNLSYFFSNCHSLTSVNLENFVTSSTTRMEYMFSNCHSLTSVNLENFDTSKVYYMNHMFYNCHSLTSVNLENFDTIKASNFEYMFSNCYKLEFIDTPNFNYQYTIRIANMFSGCYSLTSINFPISKSVSANFTGIFFDCPNLKFVNFSFVKDRNSNYKLFNKNISDTGTIILKNNLYGTSYTKYVPSNWDVTLLD